MHFSFATSKLKLPLATLFGYIPTQTMQFLLAVLWQNGGDHCQPVLRKCCVIEICSAMLIAHCTKYNGSDGVSPYNMN